MTYGFPIHFPRKTHECVNMNSLKKNKETRREGKEKEGRGERGALIAACELKARVVFPNALAYVDHFVF